MHASHSPLGSAATSTPGSLLSAVASAALALGTLAACNDRGVSADVPDVSDVGDVQLDVPSDAPADATTPDAADAALDVAPDGPSDVAPDGAPDVHTDADADTGPPPPQVRVRGHITLGEAPLWLALKVNGETVEELQVDAASEYEFDSPVTEGDTYAVETITMPERWYCQPTADTGEDAPSGVAAATDLVVDVACVPGDFDLLEQRSANIKFSMFSRATGPDTFAYGVAIIPDFGADGLPFTADDTTNNLDSTYRFDGQFLGAVGADGVGPDGTPFTADDDITERLVREADEHGNEVRYSSYSGPGPDGTWLTDDDVLWPWSRWSVMAYSDAGELTCMTENEVGADRLEDTADDVRNTGGFIWDYAVHPSLPGSGYTLRRWDGAGADGLPCTDDDDPGQFLEQRVSSDDGRTVWTLMGAASTYTEQRTKVDGATGVTVVTMEVAWTRNGDGISGPDLDTVEHYTVFNYDDAAGPPRVRYDGAGPDTLWFTEDDVTASAAGWMRIDSDGRYRLFDRTYAAGTSAPLFGPDGTWGTEDDLYESVEQHERVSATLGCNAYVTSADDDGLWRPVGCGNDAGDRTIEHVDWFEFTDDGRMTRRCRSVDPGPDGLWVTTDDVPSRPFTGACRSIAALDAGATTPPNQHLSVNTEVIGFGDDGLAFTEDDETGLPVIEAHDERGHRVFAIMPGPTEGPGSDALWRTADDNISEYHQYTFDRAGVRLEEQLFGAGDDGLWFTEDDEELYAERWGHFAVPPAVAAAWD